VLTVHDVRLSTRFLLRDRGFTPVALLCLALGIGGNLVVFTIVDSVLLRPLPYKEPERLLMVFDSHAGPDGAPEQYVVSPPNYAAWKRETRVFAQLAAAIPQSVSLAGAGEPEKIQGAAVSADWFATLGARPLLGRTFSSEEDTPPGRAVTLLGEGLWRSRFGGDPHILGRTVRLDGTSYTVIGVMPASCDFPDRSRLWTPLALDPLQEPQRLYHLLYVLGRLAPGATPEQAQAEMSALARRLELAFPDTNQGWGVELQSIREYLEGDLRPVLLILQAAVALVLLIACANVASLMLARFEQRRGEFALRAALGETRKGLVRQLLTEAFLLAALGGILGTAFAWIGLRWARTAVPPETIAVEMLRPDARLLGFAMLLVLGAGLLTGLVPVLSRREKSLQSLLPEGANRASAGRNRRRAMELLVIAEVSVVVILLVATSLLARSYLHLKKVPLGYSAHNLLTLRITFPETRYPDKTQRIALLQRALAHIEALPGVESAGATIVLPVGDRTVSALFSVKGRPPASPGEMLLINNRMVSPKYLQTLQIPLLEGRYLLETDRADTQGVVVVSRAMAEAYWPGQNALGKQVKRGGPTSENPWLTVVGVVADVQDTSLGAAVSPTWYLPMTQHSFLEYSLAVRTTGNPLSVAPDVRKAIWSLDPELPVERVMTMEQLLAESVGKERFSASLIGLFTALGLALAAAGLYGLMSYSVSRRTHEFGIRMALGAERRSLLVMVLTRTMLLAAAGLVLGSVLSVLLGQPLASLLFQVEPLDPIAFLSAGLLLLAVAFAAGFIPASRATRVDVIDCFRGN